MIEPSAARDPDSNSIRPDSLRTRKLNQARRDGYAVGSLWPVELATVTSIVSSSFVTRAASIVTLAAADCRYAFVSWTAASSSDAIATTPRSDRYLFRMLNMNAFAPRNVCCDRRGRG